MRGSTCFWSDARTKKAEPTTVSRQTHLNHAGIIFTIFIIEGRSLKSNHCRGDHIRYDTCLEDSIHTNPRTAPRAGLRYLSAGKIAKTHCRVGCIASSSSGSHSQLVFFFDPELISTRHLCRPCTPPNCPGTWFMAIYRGHLALRRKDRGHKAQHVSPR